MYGVLDAFKPTSTAAALRSTAAPILSSLTRIVAVQARSSSVPWGASRRRSIISV